MLLGGYFCYRHKTSFALWTTCVQTVMNGGTWRAMAMCIGQWPHVHLTQRHVGLVPWRPSVVQCLASFIACLLAQAHLFYSSHSDRIYQSMIHACSYIRSSIFLHISLYSSYFYCGKRTGTVALSMGAMLKKESWGAELHVHSVLPCEWKWILSFRNESFRILKWWGNALSHKMEWGNSVPLRPVARLTPDAMLRGLAMSRFWSWLNAFDVNLCYC